MRVLVIALSIALLSLALALPALAADGQPGTRTARFAALDTRLAELTRRSDDWSGSLRYRWQAERHATQIDRDRFGQFVDFKLGVRQRVTDELEIGLRLSATDQARFGADALHMFGSSEFGTSSFALDRAFVHYTPEWAGTYETADGSEAGQLEIVGGSLDNG